ncbi:hypothetical protein SASPL_142552 [Salvia splendens]|uniref:Uncharacterized protein n=1 Tax=Salvia splendens TaxID=180675 RepID=A0A8X8Z9H9_SALSN|nr:uncharacterized protein LOC121770122 [Salvia splendens]KAG6396403.1 hypothetical protein SASPL_142552 [Salvia splendens]
MEVLSPSQTLDFDFNSPRSSPHATAPSTPRDYYFSAPTSPSHISQFYKEFDEFLLDAARQSPAVPFQWEEKPGTPKSALINAGDDDLDFAFDIGRDDWETASLSAEELFDGGVIKPMKPHAVRKQRSQARRIIQGAFSPRHKKNAPPLPERGRERGVVLSRPLSRRAVRSLSPMRDDQRNLWEEEVAQTGKVNSVCVAAPSKGQKKWSLKDFFLFRSASEGRAADKDPLKKYTAALRRSSFRAIDSPGSGSGSRRKGPLSAHELHYTVNRAVSEDMKRKTFLPYKQGILGRLAFNPAVHALANGFGLSRN